MGAENPGAFVPFFASLPLSTEGQRFTAMAENANLNRAARSHSLRRQRIRERKKRISKRASSQETEVKGDDKEKYDQLSPPWFEKLVGTLAVLRHLVSNANGGKTAVLEAMLASLTLPSLACDRVLVVTNIPINISTETIVEGITKAARPGGGILNHGGIHVEEDRTATHPRHEQDPGNQSSADQPVQSYKSAVVQLRTSVHIERVRQRLLQDQMLANGNTSGNSLQVLKVNSALLFEGGWSVTRACQQWENFLYDRLVDGRNEHGFCSEAIIALREIFLSCWFTSRDTRESRICKIADLDSSLQRGGVDISGLESDSDMIDSVMLSEQDISEPSIGNLLFVFLKYLKQMKKSNKEEISELLTEYGCNESSSQQSSSKLSFKGFIQYVGEWARTDKRTVWKALLACGFNFNHQR